MTKALLTKIGAHLLSFGLLVASATAATDPAKIRGPRDLPYYDVAWAKSLTLQQMNARVVSRETVDGIGVLRVEYDAFDQPIASATGIKTVRWRQRGTLVLPPAPLRQAKALAMNVHNDDAGSWGGPKSLLSVSLGIVKAFSIPVLIHGWMPDVLEPIDGTAVHNTQDPVMRRLLAARIEDADKLPMDGSYLFNGNPLAKADMVSLTLLQRLVKQERGRDITEIAAIGNSKEGAAHWILGAIDDRVSVLAPGGYYWHDARELLDRYGKDTGWRLPWKGADRPEADGLRQLFLTAWKFCDWVDTTDAGRLVARTTTDPANWYSDIRAKHVVVFGDMGFMPEQHDGPWPFWAENKPLSAFHHPSWRYVRVYDGSGSFMDERGIGEMGLSFMPQIADVLVNDAMTPQTPVVEIVPTGPRQVRVKARAKVTSGLQHESLLLYAVSPERGLRDREYWRIQTMPEMPDGSWEFTVPPVPEGHGLTLLVVTRELAVAGDLAYWRSASSLPVERFAVPEFSIPGPRWRTDNE